VNPSTFNLKGALKGWFKDWERELNLPSVWAQLGPIFKELRKTQRTKALKKVKIRIGK
jgi:hypothetical protein